MDWFLYDRDLRRERVNMFCSYRYAWKGKYDKLQQYLWHKEKHCKANKVDKYDR